MRENHTRRETECLAPILLIDGLIDFIELD